ncbi:hypothetical protein DSO57_1007152 [Entomophthora muscae]|uniref:Uncharacterized protein n=1 Tax=Entomophthora muscae TaxID=34485 RepID=A0ACC2T7D3_9FUNG|nr:hypothetical protein DSO57_1007152 [Entomophthora muscae]
MYLKTGRILLMNKPKRKSTILNKQWTTQNCHLKLENIQAIVKSNFGINVRNDNLDALESQSTEPESNPEQNPSQTASYKDWEPNSPLSFDKVVANLPGPKLLTTTQGSANKLPVRDDGNFPKVPIPDTGGLLSEIHKCPNESCSKLPTSSGSGTEPEGPPNAQVSKQKDSRSSHPEAASGNPPVPSATWPSKTPDAKPPKLKKTCQKIKPGSALTQRSFDPPANWPATYCLLGASFGSVYFTEYPLNPEYMDYTKDNILAWDPLARTKKLTRYNWKGPWYVTKLCLFRDKCNFLPAYQLDMKPPVTPKPIPPSATKHPLDHTNKLFGIVYFTLTGVIDTIVPAASLWSWVGKSMPYLIKLAPILW